MKNGIIINQNNAERIRKALDDAQKRCSVRLVRPEQVFESAVRMEEYRKKIRDPKEKHGGRDGESQSISRPLSFGV